MLKKGQEPRRKRPRRRGLLPGTLSPLLTRKGRRKPHQEEEGFLVFLHFCLSIFAKCTPPALNTRWLCGHDWSAWSAAALRYIDVTQLFLSLSLSADHFSGPNCRVSGSYFMERGGEVYWTSSGRRTLNFSPPSLFLLIQIIGVDNVTLEKNSAFGHLFPPFLRHQEGRGNFATDCTEVKGTPPSPETRESRSDSDTREWRERQQIGIDEEIVFRFSFSLFPCFPSLLPRTHGKCNSSSFLGCLLRAAPEVTATNAVGEGKGEERSEGRGGRRRRRKKKCVRCADTEGGNGGREPLHNFLSGPNGGGGGCRGRTAAPGPSLSRLSLLQRHATPTTMERRGGEGGSGRSRNGERGHNYGRGEGRRKGRARRAYRAKGSSKSSLITTPARAAAAAAGYFPGDVAGWSNVKARKGRRGMGGKQHPLLYTSFQSAGRPGGKVKAACSQECSAATVVLHCTRRVEGRGKESRCSSPSSEKNRGLGSLLLPFLGGWWSAIRLLPPPGREREGAWKGPLQI